MNTLYEAAAASDYPGRGIIAGLSADGARAMCFYFIMGRSVNSRNRVFARDGEGIRTRAHDPKLIKDPSLIIYSPVRVLGAHTIITNGDQTDTIYDALAANPYDAAADVFARALDAREFEPDAPNYTPRVSALVTVQNGALSLAMNILKSADGDPSECRRFTFKYPRPLNGAGYYLHTYISDGAPLKSFEGEPERVALPNDLSEAARGLWAALNADNRVALFARSIDLTDGNARTLIINKHGEGEAYGA